MGPPDNPSRKHHFMPVFMLRQWVGADGRLCQFRRFGARIVPKRKFPDATGYETDLYKMNGVPPEVAQRFEQIFMASVDHAASVQHRRFLDGGSYEFDGREAGAWIRFILSLQYRHPDAVREFKRAMVAVKEAAQEQIEANYLTLRRPQDPATYEEYKATIRPGTESRHALDMIQRVTGGALLGNALIGMNWRVVDLREASTNLLISDRPLWMPRGLDKEDSFLAMPISPTKVFVFERGNNWENLLERMTASEVVKEVNQATVRRARNIVWGSSDAHLEFVIRQMGRQTERPMISEELWARMMERARDEGPIEKDAA